MEQIAAAVGSSLWQRTCIFLQSSYGSVPLIQYSGCSAAPGWNVKYRKGGKALCTLYPDDSFFYGAYLHWPKTGGGGRPAVAAVHGQNAADLPHGQ